MYLFNFSLIKFFLFLLWVFWGGVYQCDLQASNQRGSWSAFKTKWVLAGWVPREDRCPHRIQLVFWVSVPAELHGLPKRSTGSTKLPAPAAQAPAPCGGVRFSVLCLPEPGRRSDQYPQRPLWQRHRPGPKRRGQSRHLPGHQRQRCHRGHPQVKTISSPSPYPQHLPAAHHSTPQLKQ